MPNLNVSCPCWFPIGRMAALFAELRAVVLSNSAPQYNQIIKYLVHDLLLLLLLVLFFFNLAWVIFENRQYEIEKPSWALFVCVSSHPDKIIMQSRVLKRMLF